MRVRTSVEIDKLDKNANKPFDAPPSKETTQREESILTRHRSNQNTGRSNSQVDHEDTQQCEIGF